MTQAVEGYIAVPPDSLEPGAKFVRQFIYLIGQPNGIMQSVCVEGIITCDPATGNPLKPITYAQGESIVKLLKRNTEDRKVIIDRLPALVKGIQYPNGITTQNLKDAGRQRVSIVFQAVAPAVADTLLSIIKKIDGVALAASTTIPVTNNKTLRIESMTFSVKAGAAAAAFATFTLRINPTGVALIGTQSELRVDLGNTAATIGAADKITIPFPDGFEVKSPQQIGISAAAQAITNVLSVSLNGFEY